jgi:hypothetical protein
LLRLRQNVVGRIADLRQVQAGQLLQSGMPEEGLEAAQVGVQEVPRHQEGREGDGA